MEREAMVSAERKQRTREEEEMTTFQIATLGFYAVQSLIGFAQCALILMGLRQMSRASELRERESARRHEEVMKNHAENMRKHDENMKKHEENMKNHEGSMIALKTLIERTGN